MKAMTVQFDQRNFAKGGRKARHMEQLTRRIDNLKKRCHKARRGKKCTCNWCKDIAATEREILVCRHGEIHVRELERRRAYHDAQKRKN